jgi:hypothetical protein
MKNFLIYLCIYRAPDFNCGGKEFPRRKFLGRVWLQFRKSAKSAGDKRLAVETAGAKRFGFGFSSDWFW